MLRALVRLLCMVLANALGLNTPAANVLEDMSLAVHGFVIAVGLFTPVLLFKRWLGARERRGGVHA